MKLAKIGAVIGLLAMCIEVPVVMLGGVLCLGLSLSVLQKDI